MDDVEDDSQLRRGIPVAHKIYGIPQTINSANYIYFLAYQELFKFRQPWRTRPASSREASSSASSTSRDSSEAGGSARSPRRSGVEQSSTGGQQLNGRAAAAAASSARHVGEASADNRRNHSTHARPPLTGSTTDDHEAAGDPPRHSRSSSFAEQLGSVTKRQEVQRALYEGRQPQQQQVQEEAEGRARRAEGGPSDEIDGAAALKGKGKEKLDVFLDEIITGESRGTTFGKGKARDTALRLVMSLIALPPLRRAPQPPSRTRLGPVLARHTDMPHRGGVHSDGVGQ